LGSHFLLFDGTGLTGLKPRNLRPFRRHLQIVFQDPMSSLNPRLTVTGTLTEPMRVHGVGADRDERLELAAATLAQVQMERDYLWRYPHELSWGSASASRSPGRWCWTRS
jgi:peptide/nickel transport system ATP-binding protein